MHKVKWEQTHRAIDTTNNSSECPIWTPVQRQSHQHILLFDLSYSPSTNSSISEMSFEYINSTSYKEKRSEKKFLPNKKLTFVEIIIQALWSRLKSTEQKNNVEKKQPLSNKDSLTRGRFQKMASATDEMNGWVVHKRYSWRHKRYSYRTGFQR